MLFKALSMTSVLAALAVTYPASSWAEFMARVVAVHEGDRLTIYHDRKTETVFLKGIDCPELKQPCGKQEM